MREKWKGWKERGKRFRKLRGKINNRHNRRQQNERMSSQRERGFWMNWTPDCRHWKEEEGRAVAVKKKLTSSLSLSLQCESCLCWQHGTCMGLYEDNVPHNYICYYCRQTAGATRHSIFAVRKMKVLWIDQCFSVIVTEWPTAFLHPVGVQVGGVLNVSSLKLTGWSQATCLASHVSKRTMPRSTAPRFPTPAICWRTRIRSVRSSVGCSWRSACYSESIIAFALSESAQTHA